MGTFSASVTFEGPEGRLDCDALVGTQASYAVLPSSALRSIGVTPLERNRPFRTSAGRIRYCDIGQAKVRCGDYAGVQIVTFGDEDSRPILGTVTLSCLGLEADMDNERLVPAVLWLPSLRPA